MKFSDYDIVDIITKKNRVNRLIALLIGTFIIALIYNSYVAPNNLVYGGIGGLAIIINHLFGISTTITIDVITIVLIIASLIILGFKKTSYSIIGFLSYAIMVNITAPISNFFTFEFDSFLFSIIITSLLTGVGYGLVYKAGFNTGGADTIVILLQHFFKKPTEKVSNIVNGLIIVAGAITFGIVKSIYALIFLLISNYICDYVVLGVSNFKLCFIKTKHMREVEEHLTNNMEIGYTLIESTNGIGIFKKSVIMVVIPSDRFYALKKEVLKVDKKAFFISSDCYTVINGHTNELVKI